tara:strand:+ start:130 stop:960 length:831 start_codon:yes stop_codon:yes gene_type:complete
MKAIDLSIVKALLNQSIPKVVDGKDGVDGLTGSQGHTGASGERGEVGKQGLSGKDGRDAVDGLSGADGLDGLHGKDGLDGKSGKAGKIGKAGLNGIDGQQGSQGEAGPQGNKGDTGRGVTSIKVNEEDMLVITYDDGDLDIAGKMHFTKEADEAGGGYYTGAPVGSFGITGTKTNDAGELIIVGAWGKEFNTGFTSVQQRAEETNDWITLTTSFSSIPTFNTPLLGGSVYNYLYNDDTLTLYRYIDVAGGDRYFADFDGLVLENLVATKKAQTITL